MTAEAAPPRRRRVPPWLAKSLAFLAVVVFLVVLWEGYKAVGKATGGTVPFTDIGLPIRPDDTSMPHVADIIGSLFSPVSRAPNAEILGSFLLKNSVYTLHRAFVGFVLGSITGFALGALFARSRLLERGFMPFVVASQTIPLIAIAPMIVIWGGAGVWPSWLVSMTFLDNHGFSVAVIAAYLTFFPVTINALRGLRSPDPTTLELMRSYAASEAQILVKLRLPSSLPFLFTALKISAAVSVVGAVIGELPAGFRDGLGRQLLTFSYYYITGPEKLYAAVIVTAGVGIAFVGTVALAERFVMRHHRRRVDRVTDVAARAVESLTE